jgi:hypothetical protein
MDTHYFAIRTNQTLFYIIALAIFYGMVKGKQGAFPVVGVNHRDGQFGARLPLTRF